MSQDRVFFESEGDRWFRRNRAALENAERHDWPLFAVGSLQEKAGLHRVVELGCSNGARLGRLSRLLGGDRRYIGVDASAEAIRRGKEMFPGFEFHHGVLADIPLGEPCDLVIVHFVLHWVDRATLSRSVSEIDRVTKDGGFLVLGDFLPDHPQRRRYHHLPEADVYTYKQDYAKVFEALGTYREIWRMTYGHGSEGGMIDAVDGNDRCHCSLLAKSLSGYYPLVP